MEAHARWGVLVGLGLRAMFFGASSPLGAMEIWKTSAPPRVRFFFWLVMNRRCWTAERRFRHGLQYSSSCIFCDQMPETMDHLILGCVYTAEKSGPSFSPSSTFSTQFTSWR